MKRLWFLSIFMALTFHFADAKVQVAFIEWKQQDGTYLSLEPGGRLFHVAIQFEDRWLNATGYAGVHEVQNIHDLGQIYSVIELDRDIPRGKFLAEFGKKFSTEDAWSNKASTYCSKMVAQILDIAPSPMTSKMGLGVSPDRLYRALKAMPHREIKTCSATLL